MFYAFFLFWPANVIPIWVIISLLQLFIPLNLLLRSCCIGLKHKKLHVAAALVILIGVGVNLIDFSYDYYHMDERIRYTLFFMLCSFFDVLSHAIKEGLVRS